MLSGFPNVVRVHGRVLLSTRTDGRLSGSPRSPTPTAPTDSHLHYSFFLNLHRIPESPRLGCLDARIVELPAETHRIYIRPPELTATNVRIGRYVPIAEA